MDDFMKSEDQMEMMLMQMEKFPDFYNTDNINGTNNSMMEFIQSHYNNNNNNDDDVFKNQEHSSSPTFMNQHPSSLSFSDPASYFQDSSSGAAAQNRSSMAAMREMIFRIAAMQPIHIDPESVKPPKRRNVKISTDPQSVAARHRRERISERIRILQRLVPGGTKMDTASMLDEAIHYVKFLKNQVQSLERVAATRPTAAVTGIGFPVPMSSGNYYQMSHGKGYHHQSSSAQNLADA